MTIGKSQRTADNPLAFRMIGDVYYVGVQRVSSHLIASEDGHILLDACLPDSGPTILQNIRDVGFDPADLKYILITHAHTDHLGAAKYIAQQTKATVCMHAADREAASSGSMYSSMSCERGGDTKMGLTSFEPVNVDMEVSEGDVISLGEKDIHIYHTPGHTPGCCSYRFTVVDETHQYDAILFGGPGVNVFKPENLARGQYGGTMEDFEKTLERLASFPVQVWLGAHPGQNDTFAKRDQLRAGAKPNPYIDPQGWQAFLATIGEKVRQLKAGD